MPRRLPNKDAPRLIWTLNAKDIDYGDLCAEQLVNHLEGIEQLTTKMGYAELIRSAADQGIDGRTIAPRAYNLGDPMHRDDFIDDFRMSAAFNLLKHHLAAIGTASCPIIPPAVLKLAVFACTWYVRVHAYGEWPGVDNSKHFKDLDQPLTDEQWDDILQLSYTIAEYDPPMQSRNRDLYQPLDYKISSLLSLYASVNPQAECEGTKNIWVVKAAETSCGRGITVHRTLQGILAAERRIQGRTVQKYIEQPLLCAGGRKFDLRIWVLLVHTPCGVRSFIFNRVYGRVCSAGYTTSVESTADDAVHLTNYTIQRRLGGASGALVADEELLMSHADLLHLLSSAYPAHDNNNIWHTSVWPAICMSIQAVISLALPVLSTPRCQAFEFLGVDVLLEASARGPRPWVLEVNMSPAMAHRNPQQAALIRSMARQMVAIVTNTGTPEEVDEGDGRWEALHTPEEVPVTTAKKKHPLGGVLDINFTLTGHSVKLATMSAWDALLTNYALLLRLQRWSRWMLSRCRAYHLRRATAALRLQCVVRRHAAQCLRGRLLCSCAATVIQCAGRRCIARRRLHSLRCAAAAVTIQCLSRRRIALRRRWERLLACAGMRIVRFVRRSRNRVYWRAFRVLLRGMRAYRRVLTTHKRVVFHLLRLHYLRRRRCAVTVQRGARRWRVRRQLQQALRCQLSKGVFAEAARRCKEVQERGAMLVEDRTSSDVLRYAIVKDEVFEEVLWEEDALPCVSTPEEVQVVLSLEDFLATSLGVLLPHPISTTEEVLAEQKEEVQVPHPQPADEKEVEKEAVSVAAALPLSLPPSLPQPQDEEVLQAAAHAAALGLRTHRPLRSLRLTPAAPPRQYEEVREEVQDEGWYVPPPPRTPVLGPKRSRPFTPEGVPMGLEDFFTATFLRSSIPPLSPAMTPGMTPARRPRPKSASSCTPMTPAAPIAPVPVPVTPVSRPARSRSAHPLKADTATSTGTGRGRGNLLKKHRPHPTVRRPEEYMKELYQLYL